MVGVALLEGIVGGRERGFLDEKVGQPYRLIIEQDQTRQVANSSSVKLNLTDPCCTVYSTVPVQLLRDARPAGWVNSFSICASTMPRAQNMT